VFAAFLTNSIPPADNSLNQSSAQSKSSLKAQPPQKARLGNRGMTLAQPKERGLSLRIFPKPKRSKSAMKKYSTYLLPLAALTFIGSLAISGAVLLVTVLTASDIAGDLPMRYLEKLMLPFLFIAVPIIGMLVFAVILSGTFGFRKAAAPVVEYTKKPFTAEPQPEERLKAA
jgi:hypothetical protein